MRKFFFSILEKKLKKLNLTTNNKLDKMTRNKMSRNNELIFVIIDM
jgi:hypothetical protein